MRNWRCFASLMASWRGVARRSAALPRRFWPHRLVASSLRPHRLVASRLRPHRLVARWWHEHCLCAALLMRAADNAALKVYSYQALKA